MRKFALLALAAALFVGATADAATKPSKVRNAEKQARPIAEKLMKSGALSLPDQGRFSNIQSHQSGAAKMLYHHNDGSTTQLLFFGVPGSRTVLRTLSVLSAPAAKGGKVLYREDVPAGK